MSREPTFSSADRANLGGQLCSELTFSCADPDNVGAQRAWLVSSHADVNRMCACMQRKCMCDAAGGRDVVFFMHGILDTSMGWVSNGVTGSQAFAAYDQGFDVWLGNSRANPPRKHERQCLLGGCVSLKLPALPLSAVQHEAATDAMAL